MTPTDIPALIEQGLALTKPQRESHDAQHGLTKQHYLEHRPRGLTPREVINFLSGHLASVGTFTEVWAYHPLPALASYLSNGALSPDTKFHLEGSVNSYIVAVGASAGRPPAHCIVAEHSYLDTEIRRDLLPLLIPQPRPTSIPAYIPALSRSEEAVRETMSWVFGRPCSPHDVAYLRAQCPPLYGYVASRA